MGMDYSLYLVPAPPAIGHSPDSATSMVLMSGLADLGWIDPTAEPYHLIAANAGGRAQRKVTSFSLLSHELAGVVGSSSVKVEAQVVLQEKHWPGDIIGADGRSRMYDFEKASCFKPEYCESLDIVWSSALCTPIGENIVGLKCPGCNADVTGDTDSLGVGTLVPAACEACGAVLPPASLVAETHDVMTGELRPEPGPLFRFAVVLTAVHNAVPDREPVEVDSSLLEMLARVTGVPFRGLSSLT